MDRSISILAAAAVLTGLGACGDGGSAVETRDRAGEGGQAVMTAAAGSPMETAGPDRPEKARMVMTANRRETVDEKIVRLFERNGADFGARTPADYLDKVRAFTGSPPSDAERVERPNGDVLLYQASTNTFAVVSRQGVPKTMFKPTDGPSYWAEQKARAPTFGQGRASQE